MLDQHAHAHEHEKIVLACFYQSSLIMREAGGRAALGRNSATCRQEGHRPNLSPTDKLDNNQERPLICTSISPPQCLVRRFEPGSVLTSPPDFSRKPES
jgi:hypothetical protein